MQTQEVQHTAQIATISGATVRRNQNIAALIDDPGVMAKCYNMNAVLLVGIIKKMSQSVAITQTIAMMNTPIVMNLQTVIMRVHQSTLEKCAASLAKSLRKNHQQDKKEMMAMIALTNPPHVPIGLRQTSVTQAIKVLAVWTSIAAIHAI